MGAPGDVDGHDDGHDDGHGDSGHGDRGHGDRGHGHEHGHDDERPAGPDPLRFLDGRRLLSVLLVLVSTAALLLAAGSWTIRTVLLDPESVDDALVDADAIGRVTTDVLSSAEFDDIRPALGAERLQSAVDEVVAELLTHVREGDPVVLTVDIAELLEDVDPTTAAAIRASDYVDGERWDLGRVLTDRADDPPDAIERSLAPLHDLARWSAPMVSLVGLALAVGTAVLLWRINRRDAWVGTAWLTAVLVTTGVVVPMSVAVLDASLESPLAPATAAGPGTWQLPEPLRDVMIDVEHALGRHLTESARMTALAALLTAGLLACALVVTAVRRRRAAPSPLMP